MKRFHLPREWVLPVFLIIGGLAALATTEPWATLLIIGIIYIGSFPMSIRAYNKLQEACGDDRQAFARAWRERAHAWSFDDINQLIKEHNDWYPIESGLPLDPRTRDYVPIRGRSYRRTPLGPEWVLEQFPAEP